MKKKIIISCLLLLLLTITSIAQTPKRPYRCKHCKPIHKYIIDKNVKHIIIGVFVVTTLTFLPVALDKTLGYE